MFMSVTPKRAIIAYTSIGRSSIMLPPSGQELPRIATAISRFVHESCIRGNVSLDTGGYRSIGCIRACLHQRSDVKPSRKLEAISSCPGNREITREGLVAEVQ